MSTLPHESEALANAARVIEAADKERRELLVQICGLESRSAHARRCIRPLRTILDQADGVGVVYARGLESGSTALISARTWAAYAEAGLTSAEPAPAILDRCRAAVERLLAALGDQDDPELIQLQHELIDLTRPRS